MAAEERCALAETEIRQEVSVEMASLLHDMEANYKVGCPKPYSLNICVVSLDEHSVLHVGDVCPASCNIQTLKI